MANKLKTFDFDQPSTLTTTEKATYPWDMWFDGDIWQLTWDEDYHTHPLMMERIIRTRATGRGAKVRLRHVPMNGEPWGKLIVQRTDVVGPEEFKRIERRSKAAKTRADKANGKNGRKVSKRAPLPPSKMAKRQPVAVN